MFTVNILFSGWSNRQKPNLKKKKCRSCDSSHDNPQSSLFMYLLHRHFFPSPTHKILSPHTGPLMSIFRRVTTRIRAPRNRGEKLGTVPCQLRRSSYPLSIEACLAPPIPDVFRSTDSRRNGRDLTRN